MKSIDIQVKKIREAAIMVALVPLWLPLAAWAAADTVIQHIRNRR